VGAHHARRSGARYAAGGKYAIDYLDFASPCPAAARWASMPQQVAGRDHARMGTPIVMDAAVKAKVDACGPLGCSTAP